MATRYERETPRWIYDLLREIRDDHHPHLAEANFFIWLDNQKRTAGGQIVLGSIAKANAKTRTLAGEDKDYEIILDAQVFKNLNNVQQHHLMHWLLCHCQVTTEDEEAQFSLISPEYPVFAAEMEFNSSWRQTWDDMRSLAAQVHTGKTGAPTNDPDNPHMFGENPPQPNAGSAARGSRECPYQDIRADACGQCEDPEDCKGCCYFCEAQNKARESDGMPEGCKAKFEAGSGDGVNEQDKAA